MTISTTTLFTLVLRDFLTTLF